MASPVPKSQIQEIVGVERDPQRHWGRWVTEEDRFYILHSRACLNSTPHLLECPYSISLKRGLDKDYWYGLGDRPVVLSLHLEAGLVPRGV